jgi:superfamily II DNA or RNA helicase
MKAIITNKFTVIQNPSEQVVRHLNELMSYVDKQKQYQVRRLKKNKFNRGKSFLKKMEDEVTSSMLKHLDGGHVAFNSGLSYHIEKMNIEIEDQRKETGAKLALPWKKKPYDPRPYQMDAVDLAEANWRGIINFATGMGKTLTALHLIKRIRKNTLIVVPSDSIAKQFYNELTEAFGDKIVGIYGGGKKKIRPITVGIAASVVRNVDAFKEADLGMIIFDEVHHIAASTFYDIALGLGDIGRIYGLTATDYRSDGKDIMINAGCGDVIIRRDIKWGINNGFLAKPRFIVEEVDTYGHDYTNDKLKNYKEHVLNNKKMTDKIREDIKYYMDQGKSVLCLVGEVSHGEALSAELGIPFAQGKDKKSQEYVEALNAGRIRGLVGTGGKIGEGSDTKRVDVLIIANFIASKGPVIQAVGRGLRICEDKTECIIKDYIPKGSSMLSRHARGRVNFYREITPNVVVKEAP